MGLISCRVTGVRFHFLAGGLAEPIEKKSGHDVRQASDYEFGAFKVRYSSRSIIDVG